MSTSQILYPDFTLIFIRFWIQGHQLVRSSRRLKGCNSGVSSCGLVIGGKKQATLSAVKAANPDSWANLAYRLSQSDVLLSETHLSKEIVVRQAVVMPKSTAPSMLNPCNFYITNTPLVLSISNFTEKRNHCTVLTPPSCPSTDSVIIKECSLSRWQRSTFRSAVLVTRLLQGFEPWFST